MTEEDLQKKADEIREARKDTPAVDTGEGNQPAASPVIEQAHAAAKRMEEANAEKSRLIAEEQNLVAAKTIAGRAEAGQEIKPESQDDKDQAVANDMIKAFE